MRNDVTTLFIILPLLLILKIMSVGTREMKKGKGVNKSEQKRKEE